MFRNDIEGLRGVAVLFVIFYHYDLNIFSGGYIGVDTFFVISGYLITGVIYNSINNGNFNFSIFYNNRCKRILPSSVFILFLVSFIISKNKDNLYKLKVYKDCLWALLLNANTNYYYQELDYYKSFQKPTPILHYWSLSLEEQFYFFYPFIVFIFYKKFLLFILFILFLISLYICIKYTSISKPFSYYILFSRAWQLLSGCIARIIENRIEFCSFSNLSLVLLIYTSNYFNKYTNYPYFYSIFPTLLSVLIVKKNVEKNAILELHLLRKVGEISFSLYLVHYPALILSKINSQYFILPTLSVIIFYFIEKPFHYHNYKYISPILFGILIIFTFIVTLLRLIIKEKKKNHIINKLRIYDYNRIKNIIDNFHRHTCNLCCPNEFNGYNFDRFIFFLGDSHVRVLIFSLSNYAKAFGWKIYHRWIPNINIIKSNYKLYEFTLGSKKYDIIITTYHNPLKKDERILFKKNFYSNLLYLLSKAKYIIVVDDNPFFTINPHQVIIKEMKDYVIINKNCIANPAYNVPIHNSIIHINFSKYYYSDNKCRLIYNNTIMYFDNNHLSIEFVKIIGNHLLNIILSKLNYIKPKAKSNTTYKCDYWTPQIDSHYKYCKKC